MVWGALFPFGGNIDKFAVVVSLSDFALPNRIVVVGLAPRPRYYSPFLLLGVLLSAAGHRNKAKDATWAG